MKGTKGDKNRPEGRIDDAAAGLRICLWRSTKKAWAAYVFAVPLPVQGTTPAQGRLVFQLPIRQLLGVRHVKGPYAPTTAARQNNRAARSSEIAPDAFGTQAHVRSTYRTNFCTGSGKSRVTSKGKECGQSTVNRPGIQLC